MEDADQANEGGHHRPKVRLAQRLQMPLRETVKPALILFLIWLGLPTVNFLIAGDVVKAGQIGDAFGVASSMLAVVTVLYVINSFQIQARQLTLYQSEVSANIRMNTIVALLQYTPIQIEQQKDTLCRLNTGYRDKRINLDFVVSELKALSASWKEDEKARAKQLQTIGTLEAIQRLLIAQDRLYNELMDLSHLQKPA